jgi:hypothetical protein
MRWGRGDRGQITDRRLNQRHNYYWLRYFDGANFDLRLKLFSRVNLQKKKKKKQWPENKEIIKKPGSPISNLDLLGSAAVGPRQRSI